MSTNLKSLQRHADLSALLEKTPFHLLENESTLIPVGDSFLNVCGLGEYSGGRCLPNVGFRQYDVRYPGLILAHNPDSVARLTEYPGELMLCGHIHGGQVNFPWVAEQLTLVEHPEYRAGLYRVRNRWMYVGRGIGAVLPFRWRARPEIALLTLEEAK